MGYYGCEYKKPVSVRIDTELLEKCKKKLEEENKNVSYYSRKSFTDVVEDGLRVYLEKPMRK